MHALLVANAAATLAMTGLIWFVQVVHYPLYARVGESAFPGYEREHVRRTTWVVGPAALAEAATAAMLLVARPSGVPAALPWTGAFLLVVIWSSTALVQVPAHRALERDFDSRVAGVLVRSNWVRTLAWSARAILVAAMLWAAT